MNGVLLCGILMSSLSNLGLSEGKKRRMDDIRVIWYNYIVTFLLACGMLLRSRISWELTPQLVFTGLIGALSGVLYLVTFLILQRSIAVIGPGMSTLFSKLGVVVTALLTAPLWHESLTPVRLSGILLSCIALFLLHAGGFVFHRVLPLLFLSSGVNEIMKKVYTFYGDMSYQYLYYWVIFLVCLLLSTVLLLRRPKTGRPDPREALLGGGVGLCNMGATYAMTLALTAIPVSIAFPTQCGGVILLTSAAGAVRYGESFSPAKAAALLLTVVSIVLMNL